MLRYRTTTGALAAIAALATSVPALADTCNRIDPPKLLGQGHTLVIARPEGREMCVTINKSAGLAAGRVTVVAVRPVLNAGPSEIEVLVTKERTLRKGGAPHHAADLSAPELLGSSQVFVNADEDRHLTVRVRPRHGADYRLAVIVHEINLAELIAAATIDTIAHLTLNAIAEEFGGKTQALPFLDRRLLGIALKSVSGTIKGHSAEEIGAGIAIQLAIKEALAGADVPRELAILVATFTAHAWREVSKNALRRFEWPLPDHVRDTSRPLSALLSN